MCYLNIVKKKRKIYEASKLYFKALTQAKSQEDIDRLGKKDWRNWRLNTAKILLIWRGYISSIWNRNGK